MEPDTRNFETEYHKNYWKTENNSNKRSAIIWPQQEFLNPIAQTKIYLTPNEPTEPETENYSKYVEKNVSSNKLFLKNYKEPVKSYIVAKVLKDSKDTTYHQHFCSRETDTKIIQEGLRKEFPEELRKNVSPENETSQKCHYRDHSSLNPGIYSNLTKPIINPTILNSEYAKNIYKRSDDTEYSATFGSLAEFILENNIYRQM